MEIKIEQKEWVNLIQNHDSRTGIYHVDGAEYNVDETTLIVFIATLLANAKEEGRLEALEK
jgi:hypothetical protein